MGYICNNKQIIEMKTICIIMLLSFVATAQETELGWAKGMGSTSNDVGVSSAVDTLGNVYTTGFFVGTVDFDPGVGVYNLTSIGESDIFIQKLDADGNFVWAKSMGSASSEGGRSIAIDASGNVYTTGVFRETVDFDPGAGVYNLISQGATDIFVQKLDTDGNFAWANRMGGSGIDIGESVAVDYLGNVYTTGSFLGTVDFDPGMEVYNLTSQGGADIFIQKLDTDGNFVWAKSVEGSHADNGRSIAVDTSGNVYTAGTFIGTADFDPGAGVYYLSSEGDMDIFIQKLDTNGNFVWAKSMGGINWDYGYSVAVDVSGNVYTTGSFRETVDFDPGAGIYNLTSQGGTDIFIQKLDADGNFVWANRMGGSTGDNGRSIAVDILGNVYTTGSFRGTIDFDPGMGIHLLSSAGWEDIFIQKLDANGDFVWAKSMGSTDSDTGYSIVIDILGNIYTSGVFRETVDFDPEAGVYNLISEGGTDIFVHKLMQVPLNVSDINQTSLKFYPNPVKDILYFDEEIQKVTITDITGKVLSTHSNSSQVDMSGFQYGLYLIVIETENGKEMRKIVKR